ncbi:Golgi resident protein GCP60 [Cichlidogyrus casuarinus]|uniref:Golgi resident protein GCP60 n=1 Tax=Cichlidogyrus casuarinus TaxID=1844966 RepID=A0ABD2QK88_9PLAT
MNLFTNFKIRVPTNKDGNSIVWEFATDYYDLGFGLYFAYSKKQKDEETKEGEVLEEEEIELIPVGRQNTFKEVYCGSHIYPGPGNYILKFDNSFSLLRTKNLFYRVFYSKPENGDKLNVGSLSCN